MANLPDGVTEADVQKALNEAHRHAESRTRRMPVLTEGAIDGATDAVVWAVSRFDATRGVSFGAFAASAVKRFVHRAIARQAHQHASRPEHVDVNDTAVAAPHRSTCDTGRDVQLPLAVQELPEDMRFAVRLFYLDGYNLRDCGLLMGCEMETVRRRLQEAAKALGSDLIRPERSAGAKRMCR